jgi:hypothetical protein
LKVHNASVYSTESSYKFDVGVHMMQLYTYFALAALALVALLQRLSPQEQIDRVPGPTQQPQSSQTH